LLCTALLFPRAARSLPACAHDFMVRVRTAPAFRHFRHFIFNAGIFTKPAVLQPGTPAAPRPSRSCGS